jgi:hypothetical protein
LAKADALRLGQRIPPNTTRDRTESGDRQAASRLPRLNRWNIASTSMGAILTLCSIHQANTAMKAPTTYRTLTSSGTPVTAGN